MGKIITFYSYKGGVGRTMALANIATLLSQRGNKVLVIDFDLEAPGIENYFESFNLSENKKSECNGIVDLICGLEENNNYNWKDALLHYSYKRGEIKVDILPSGRKTKSYSSKIQNINWESLFKDYKLGNNLEKWRNEWKEEYDYILIDSRTGLSDIGGICTIYLPDIITFLFTTNDISLDGCINIIDRVKKARNLIPFDRDLLTTLPLPSRDESRTENKLALKWHSKFALKLEPYYADWLPKDFSSGEVIDLLRIPYIPIWSFGDRLPVIEEGVSKIDSIGFIYDKIAQLINSDFDWVKITEQKIPEIKKEINTKTKRNMKAEEYIKDRLDNQIEWYSRKSRKNRYNFYLITTIQIILAALVPLLTNLKMEYYESITNLIVSACGVVIVITTGLLSVGKYRENWMNYRKTSETLKREKIKFMTESYPYDMEDSFRLLVDNVEEIFANENSDWVKNISKIKSNYKE